MRRGGIVTVSSDGAVIARGERIGERAGRKLIERDTGGTGIAAGSAIGTWSGAGRQRGERGAAASAGTAVELGTSIGGERAKCADDPDVAAAAAGSARAANAAGAGAERVADLDQRRDQDEGAAGAAGLMGGLAWGAIGGEEFAVDDDAGGGAEDEPRRIGRGERMSGVGAERAVDDEVAADGDVRGGKIVGGLRFGDVE